MHGCVLESRPLWFEDETRVHHLQLGDSVLPVQVWMSCPGDFCVYHHGTLVGGFPFGYTKLVSPNLILSLSVCYVSPHWTAKELWLKKMHIKKVYNNFRWSSMQPLLKVRYHYRNTKNQHLSKIHMYVFFAMTSFMTSEAKKQSLACSNIFFWPP